MTPVLQLRAQVLQLAARPEGMSTADIPAEKQRIGRICWDLCNAEQLFRGRRTGKDVRFFSTLKAADAYAARTVLAAPVSISNHGRPAWSDDTPVVMAPGFKFTSCPSPAEFGPAAKLARAVSPDAGSKA